MDVCHIRGYMCTCIRVYVQVCVYTYTCVWVLGHARVYTCICVRVYLCTFERVRRSQAGCSSPARVFLFVPSCPCDVSGLSYAKFALMQFDSTGRSALECAGLTT